MMLEPGKLLGIARLRWGMLACGCLLAACGTLVAAPAKPAALEGFLADYCYDCHDAEMRKGELNLEDFPYNPADRANFLQWATVFNRVSKGEMPPPKKTRPEAVAMGSFLGELEHGLAVADQERHEASGRTVVRRLNRTEYENTLRDLLAMPQLEIAESLPPEGSVDGYDKCAEALDFSHVHASRLLEAADEALRRAIAPATERPRSRITRFEVRAEGLSRNCQGMYSLLRQGRGMPMVGMEIDHSIERDNGDFGNQDAGSARDLPPYFDSFVLFINEASNLGMTIRTFRAPVPGYYKIRVRGFGVLNDHGKLLPSERMETVGFYSNDRTLGYCDVKPYEPTTAEITVWLDPEDVVKPLVASAPFSKIRAGTKGKETFEVFKAHGVAFQWFELEGPLYDTWPPESHQRLFGELPAVEEKFGRNETRIVDVQSEHPRQDAARLIRAFVERALRRPVTGADVQLPLQIARTKLEAGATFLESMLAAYRAVLTSPDFLLLDERAGQLDGHMLAARLSYFLWNSPPDAALRALADSGELLKPEVLRAQTDRLLDDSKSARFLEHFLDHWLELQNISLTQPDENLYPDYTPWLLDSMLGETRGYFAEMLREDLGVKYLVASDFSILNQRLAELYNIPGVLGSPMRRVALPEDCHRGGLLTQASLLKVTANGTTTSPVVRGKYVLTHLLGDPPPPPPPTVPAVDPDISGATTIREQLARHRADAACASCHAKIDPPGFALESFDVMGGFRERYRSLGKGDLLGLQIDGRKALVRVSLPVDPAGQLPDGTRFAGIGDFRKLLLQRDEQMARNLLSQFIIYGTGAAPDFADRPVVDAMMRELAASGYGVRSMIHAVVQSPLFREK